MDRGAWWATVHRVEKSQIQLSTVAQQEEEEALGSLCAM